MNNPQMDNNRPDFNMAVLFITRLDTRNSDCDLAFHEGDLLKVYRCLRNIYLMILYKVKKEEDKDLFNHKYSAYMDTLDNLFKEVSGMLSGDNKMVKLNMSETEKRLDEIRQILYLLQWDLHLIFPEKIKISWEDEIKGDFE